MPSTNIKSNRTTSDSTASRCSGAQWSDGRAGGRLARLISPAILIVLFALFCPLQPAAAQFLQQGAKLVGSGYSTSPSEGYSVAVSADGNTLVVGGPPRDVHASDPGQVWVFIRSGGAWSQQAGPLVGSGFVYDGINGIRQGYSVALSGDGNTLAIGGPGDNSTNGAVWIFTRSGGNWVQQGVKLTGTIAGSQLGWSVALSSDGNTLIAGAPFGSVASGGGAFVYTRSNGTWTAQARLVGTNYIAGPAQGWSVGLSADGNTAIVGGPGDDPHACQSGCGIGAAWVFTRTGNTWTQQGSKLVGTGYVGDSRQGTSVALSGDGNAAIVGGPVDNSSTGAVWVYTQSGGTWTQQGAKVVVTDSQNLSTNGQGNSVALSGDGNTALVGTDGSANGVWVFARHNGTWSQYSERLNARDATPGAGQGFSVALSSDAVTAVTGGPSDGCSIGACVGAVYAFTYRSVHDFNHDYMDDILWCDTSGNTAMWLMNGASVAAGASLGNVGTAWSSISQRDFNGDGKADILWRDNSGDLALWTMNGSTISSSALVGTVGSPWTVAGTGDYDNNGQTDILWRNTSTGDVAIWFMNGATIASAASVARISTAWNIVGSSRQGILWQDGSGDTSLWIMNGSSVASAVSLGTVPTTWSVVGVGDFDGDGNLDIVWRDTSGNVAIWFLSNTGGVVSSAFVANVSTSWTIAETGDFNGDGKSDILWRNTGTGDVAVWFMNGSAVASAGAVANVATAWSIQGANAD